MRAMLTSEAGDNKMNWQEYKEDKARYMDERRDNICPICDEITERRWRAYDGTGDVIVCSPECFLQLYPALLYKIVEDYEIGDR